MVLVLAMLKVDCKSLSEGCSWRWARKYKASRRYMEEGDSAGAGPAAVAGAGLGGSGTAVVGLMAAQVVCSRCAGDPNRFAAACGFSVGFAVLVWRMRAATGLRRILGGVICMNMLWSADGLPMRHPALPALLALFVLTFAATRYGRQETKSAGRGGGTEREAAGRRRLSAQSRRRRHCARRVFPRRGMTVASLHWRRPLRILFRQRSGRHLVERPG